MDVDVKGAAFEGLLEKAASEGKKGAGQYFTPRLLIQAIVRVHEARPAREAGLHASATRRAAPAAFSLRPTNGSCQGDQAACSTAPTPGASRRKTYFGQDLVPRPRRLALMNLFLHGVEPHIYLGDTIYEPAAASAYDVVLTNPPFGTKGANQAPDRDDFTIETSNKQLNFVQHVLTILKPGGRAAIVLPDNCLFEDKAGEVFEIAHAGLRPAHRPAPAARHVHALQPGRQSQRHLLQEGPPTETRLDFRRPLQRPGHHQERPPAHARTLRRVREVLRRRPERPSKAQAGRTRRTTAGAASTSAKSRSATSSSTFKWLKDDSLEDADELPEPEELATDAIAELEGAVAELNAVLRLLENGDSSYSEAAVR